LPAVIFGEHCEHGPGAPIAKHVIETYFAKKEGRAAAQAAAAGRAPLSARPDEDPGLAAGAARGGRGRRAGVVYGTMTPDGQLRETD
jgi:hypothetical protein